MIIISYIFILFCFFKGFYYALFELKNQKNKKAATLVFILSFLGLIIPVMALLLSY